MRQLRHLLPLWLSVLLLCLCGPVSAEDPADSEKPVKTGVPKSYKRNVKRMGHSIRGRIVGNKKGLKKSKHPYSSRSFSSRQYRQRQLSKLREMHQQAFGNKPAPEEEEDPNDEDWEPGAGEAKPAPKGG